MLARDKCAAVLVSFGLLGLAISPKLIAPAASATDQASVAIASGPHLRLLREREARPASSNAETGSMVCSNVIRLAVADIGLACTRQHLAADDETPSLTIAKR